MAPGISSSYYYYYHYYIIGLYASTIGLPKHWRRRPAGRDRPGYELSRMIYGHSIWVSGQLNQLNGVLRTDQLGRHLWKRLRR